MNGTEQSLTQTERRATSTYRCEAKKFLKNAFLRIGVRVIDFVLQCTEYRFVDAYNRLSAIEAGHSSIGGNGRGQFDDIPHAYKVFLKSDRKWDRFRLTDELLCDEIENILNLHAHEKIATDAVHIGGDREGHNAATAELETDCLCCYGEYPRAEMRECKHGSGHFVCKKCIYSYVTEQLDGNDSTVFQCIVDADCQHKYSMALLDQVVSPKLSKRVNDRIFRDEMKKSGINHWTCPKCAYIGFVDREFPWINCPECLDKYCTSCNGVFHDGQTCDEARRETRLKDPKHRAHEAMSLASKRVCPHCNQEYIKGEGCNKITCGKCKKLSCYLCGEKIQDYSHFGKSLGKCELFTDRKAMEQLDRTKRQEAGRMALADAGITDEREILSILASPTKKARNVRNHKAAQAPVAVPNQIRPAPQLAPRDRRRNHMNIAPEQPAVNPPDHPFRPAQQLAARLHLPNHNAPDPPAVNLPAQPFHPEVAGRQQARPAVVPAAQAPVAVPNQIRPAPQLALRDRRPNHMDIAPEQPAVNPPDHPFRPAQQLAARLHLPNHNAPDRPAVNLHAQPLHPEVAGRQQARPAVVPCATQEREERRRNQSLVIGENHDRENISIIRDRVFAMFYMMQTFFLVIILNVVALEAFISPPYQPKEQGPNHSPNDVLLVLDVSLGGSKVVTLVISETEEPADRVYQFLQEHNVVVDKPNSHFHQLMNQVCFFDEVICNRLEPVLAEEEF